MSEQHDYEHDPRTHRAQEADEPQSVERVPGTSVPAGRIDQAGGQAGQMAVDNDPTVGDESATSDAASDRQDATDRT